ncbi:MAG: hypothetical protein U0326_24145 [Polyangiales bacterium]
MSRASHGLSLVAVAVVSGLLWRAEVELHGWAGLAWTGYFHLAVPASVALFLGWVAWWIDAPTRAHRIRAVVALALYAAAAVPATEWSLRIAFGCFGFLWDFWWLALWWWLLAPTTVAGLLVACRAPPGWRRWLASQALFALAPWLATIAIGVFPQHGHSDLIHAVKSGAIVPFLVVALGVGVRARRRGDGASQHEFATPLGERT